MTELNCFSFTFDAWIRLPQNCCEGTLPVVCSREGLLCLYVENGYVTLCFLWFKNLQEWILSTLYQIICIWLFLFSFLHGEMSGRLVTGLERLIGGEWNHIGLRFEATGNMIHVICIYTYILMITYALIYNRSCLVINSEWHHYGVHNECSDLSGTCIIGMCTVGCVCVCVCVCVCHVSTCVGYRKDVFSS